MKKPNGGRYLHGNRGSARPRHILLLRVETTEVPDGAGGEAYVALRAETRYLRREKDGNDPIPQDRTFDKAQDLWPYVENLTPRRGTLYVFSARSGAVLWLTDAFRTLAVRGWRRQFLLDRTPRLILTIRKGESKMCFLSMNNFLPGEIDDWHDILGSDRPQSPTATQTQTLVQELAQPFLDLLETIVKRYLSFLDRHDCGRFALTLASQSLNSWRHRFLRWRPVRYHDEDLRIWERSALFGGRKQAFKPGRFTGGAYVQVDIRGMYSYLMQTRLLPSEIAEDDYAPPIPYVAEKLRTHLAIAETWVKGSVPIYPLRHRRKVQWVCRKGPCILCSATLKRSIDLGDVERFGRVVFYRASYLLAAYAKYWYEIKTEAQSRGDRFEEILAKLIGNMVFGKLAQNVPVQTHAVPCDPEACEIIHLEDLYDDSESTIVSLVGMMTQEQGSRPDPRSFPAIAAHITDYGRDFLWSLMNRIGLQSVYYCDTDGWIMDRDHLETYRDLLRKRGAGSLRVTAEGDDLEIFRQGDYKIGGKEKCSGRPRRAEEVASGIWQCQEWPGLRGILADSRPCYYPKVRVRWSRKLPLIFTHDSLP